MNLENWRKDEKISYEKMARALNISTVKAFRICQRKDVCIRLSEAYAIVQLTKGEVDYIDLLDSVDC